MINRNQNVKCVLIIFCFCLLFSYKAYTNEPDEVNTFEISSVFLIPKEIIDSYFPASENYLIPENKKVSAIIKHAQTYEKKANFKQASKNYLLAYKRIKNSIQAPYIRFKQCTLANSISESINGLKEIITDYPSFPLLNAVRFELSKLYYLNKDYESSLSYLMEIEEEEDNTIKIFTPYTCILSGLICFEKGDYDNSINYYKKSLKELSLVGFNDRNQFIAKSYLGISEAFIGLKRYKEAEELLKRIYGSFSSILVQEDALYLLGNCYLDASKLDYSYSAFIKIIEGYLHSPYTIMAKKKIEHLLQQKKDLNNVDISGVFDRRILECSYLIDMTKEEESIVKNSFISFSIQVGSFIKEANAVKLVEELNGKGFSSYSLKVELEDKEVYRVRVGYFSSRIEAEKAKQNLEKYKYKGFIVKEK